MMATATIVGWTFVNIYKKYVNVKLILKSFKKLIN